MSGGGGVDYKRLRSALRRFWLIHWYHRADALKACREPYTGSDKRIKWSYKCAGCGGLFKAKEVAVDHCIPCGSLLCRDDEADFVYKLLFGELQVLCRDNCHRKKTREERSNK